MEVWLNLYTRIASVKNPGCCMLFRTPNLGSPSWISHKPQAHIKSSKVVEKHDCYCNSKLREKGVV